MKQDWTEGEASNWPNLAIYNNVMVKGVWLWKLCRMNTVLRWLNGFDEFKIYIGMIELSLWGHIKSVKFLYIPTQKSFTGVSPPN